ncbi:sugar phosphate isomerase/epimerase [halophilic archaeon]|nr:sugar phosphate isomerase/epimerase [halophilic archaeon]
MRIGLCTISNAEASVETVLSQAARAGYDGVEIWGRDHVGDGSERTCRAIRREADRLGLDVPVYGSYLRAGGDTFADARDHELAVAERLAADRIRVWAGTQEYAERDSEHWERAVADLRELTALAADRGVEVTVERHAGTLTDECEGARRLVEAVDDSNFGLNYQPPFDAAPDAIVAEARELAPLSNHVHVQAVSECGGESRCPLSEAFYDVSRVLAAFKTAGFEGYVNVEFVHDSAPYAEAITVDLDYLRSAVG